MWSRSRGSTRAQRPERSRRLAVRSPSNAAAPPHKAAAPLRSRAHSPPHTQESELSKNGGNRPSSRLRYARRLRRAGFPSPRGSGSAQRQLPWWERDLTSRGLGVKGDERIFASAEAAR